MGSANFNLFHLDGSFPCCCCPCPCRCPCHCCGNGDKRTETYFNEYEDNHIKVSCKSIKEIVNGITKNVTNSKYIFNKDGYYKPNQILPC